MLLRGSAEHKEEPKFPSLRKILQADLSRGRTGQQDPQPHFSSELLHHLTRENELGFVVSGDFLPTLIRSGRGGRARCQNGAFFISFPSSF